MAEGLLTFQMMFMQPGHHPVATSAISFSCRGSLSIQRMLDTGARIACREGCVAGTRLVGVYGGMVLATVRNAETHGQNLL